MIRIPVPVDRVRTIVDPNIAGAKTVYALIRATDLPELPIDPDPRVPKVNRVVKRIQESLASNSGHFHQLNRGITVSAKAATYDNQTEVLTLDLPTGEDCYGILDGGHTDFAVRNTIFTMDETQQSSLEQYIRLEVIVGVEDILAEIAEARNFSTSLKRESLANRKGEFNWLLDCLGPTISAHIRRSENDSQEVSIVDVIQRLAAVNLTLFPENQAPLEAYKNAGKCLEWFIDPSDRYEFKKMAKIAPTVLRLFDYIRYKWAEIYNSPDETGKRGRMGKTVEATQRKRGRGLLSTYYFLKDDGSSVKGDYPIEKGFAIPVLAGFRALLKRDEDGFYQFYDEPISFFNTHGKKLITVVKNASDAAGNNPHIVGRDPQVYNNTYSEVRRWYLEQQFSNR